MKKIFIFLAATLSVSVFASPDLLCGVDLIDIKTNQVLAQKLFVQNTNGITVTMIRGTDFYIESKKRRFLKKPKVATVISIWAMLDTGTNMGSFQFYRQDLITEPEELGSMIEVKAGEEKFNTIDSKYYVKSYCNIRS